MKVDVRRIALLNRLRTDLSDAIRIIDGIKSDDRSLYIARVKITEGIRKINELIEMSRARQGGKETGMATQAEYLAEQAERKRWEDAPKINLEQLHALGDLTPPPQLV